MGGKSKSSSSSNTTTNYYDDRVTTGANSNIYQLEGTGNSVNLLDAGAIENSFVFAEEIGSKSLDNSLILFEKALEFAGDSTNKVIKANNENFLNLVDSQKSESERVVTKLAPYLMGGVSLVAVVLLMKGAK